MTLAEVILLSTDNYIMRNEEYFYDKMKLRDQIKGEAMKICRFQLINERIEEAKVRNYSPYHEMLRYSYVHFML